jgi:hypothetical protein
MLPTVYPLPVEQEEVAFFAFLWLFVVIVVIAVRVFIPIWMYTDAKSRGLDAVIWLVIGLFGGILGLIVYIIVRHDRPGFLSRQSYPPPPYYPPPPGYYPPEGQVVYQEVRTYDVPDRGRPRQGRPPPPGY